MIQKELLDYKEKNGLTVYAIAKKLQVSPNSVKNWLDGKKINKAYEKMVKEMIK